MAIELANVAPFGRSLKEYQHLFNLTTADLQKRILGVADGPASFNAEATRLGSHITSVDPLYQFSGSDIQARFDAVVDDIITQVEATPNDWTWSYHQSPADLRHNREQALQLFLADYSAGTQAGRYQVGALPQLNFPDQTFELALCSHFLFLYAEHHSEAFHLAAIQEMLRVSQEIRVFPLLTLKLQPSPYLEKTVQLCQDQGFQVKITKVNYELQKGGNQMLTIFR